MDNKEIASHFKLCGQLMELHGENKFKVRSYSNAAFQISRFAESIADMDPDYYGTIPGIGNNLIPKLEELLDTGQMSYLNQWIERTPDGVIEMLGVKGIGPSKVRMIWDELGIESIGELLYACNENRLIDLKGFGDKTQAQVKASIEFILEHRSSFHYASIEPLIQEIIREYTRLNPNGRIALVGEAARKCLTVNQLEFLTCNSVETPSIESKIKVSFHEVIQADFDLERFSRSAHSNHLEHLDMGDFSTDEAVYTKSNTHFIPIEMREGHQEFEWAQKHKASELIEFEDLTGCLHNHSTYSDGIHKIDQMAQWLKNNGYQYFGISDHSQTAVYAGGLKPDDIVRQHEEIEALNDGLGNFRILKGIESDILSNGDLDYENDVLMSFDFIVASVHSAMKMDEKAATTRLIKAVENSYTNILGHPTGRLLLSRPGYPIDHRKVIDACAANNVAIELNANPMRLDIDWRWIPYCMDRGVYVSINPDAHRIEGFDHMKYGVYAARKGGLIKDLCLNAQSLEKVEEFFNSK